MTHGDDAGLVFPPRIAPIQVIIMAIWKTADDKMGTLLKEVLHKAGVKIKVDDSEQRTSGWKFNFWEMKIRLYSVTGVPLKLEVGPRDVANRSVVVSRRDVPGKPGKDLGISMEPSVLVSHVKSSLEDIQAPLLQRATSFRDRCLYSNIADVNSYEELKEVITEGKWARGPWSASDAEELKVNEETGATLRCYPFEQPQGFHDWS
ncbi:hypothetical protein MUK42_10412 [Musa troglodytarum]|uniref:proline--tRNA ligase n=1 Tax=Musa troglodytarum TaxID=320322 RepID=A0A9E7GKT9_9LILI|nr:hypothetical protein MUK42_10412 [Musa troglodytarum]